MVQHTPRSVRVWPSLAVGVGVLAALGMVSFLAQGLATAAAYGVEFPPSGELMSRWMLEHLPTAKGFCSVLLPIHGTMVLLAVVAALLSREPTARRLGLVGSRLPAWSYPVLMLATVAVDALGHWLGGHLLGEPSVQYKALAVAFNQTQGIDALVVVGWGVVIASFAEELLFRGYVLQRLVKRWNPWLAVALTSVLFAAIHPGLYLMAMVLPLGLWCGIVAWRCGSVWPAMACHAFSNVTITLLCRHGGVDASKVWAYPSATAIAMLVPGVVAFFFAVRLLVRSESESPVTAD